MRLRSVKKYTIVVKNTDCTFIPYISLRYKTMCPIVIVHLD